MMVPVTTGVISIAQLADELAQHHFDERGEKAHAEDRREDFIGAAASGLDHEPGTEDHADERKTGALQAQQARTDRAEPPRLDKGAQARDEQRHADQVRHFALQAQGAAHDQGRGDDADETGQHMLQGGEDRGGQVRAVVEAVDQVVVARSGGFFRGGHGDCVPKGGPGQKMEAQDARKTILWRAMSPDTTAQPCGSEPARDGGRHIAIVEDV